LWLIEGFLESGLHGRLECGLECSGLEGGLISSGLEGWLESGLRETSLEATKVLCETLDALDSVGNTFGTVDTLVQSVEAGVGVPLSSAVLAVLSVQCLVGRLPVGLSALGSGETTLAFATLSGSASLGLVESSLLSFATLGFSETSLLAGETFLALAGETLLAFGGLATLVLGGKTLLATLCLGGKTLLATLGLAQLRALAALGFQALAGLWALERLLSALGFEGCLCFLACTALLGREALECFLRATSFATRLFGGFQEGLDGFSAGRFGLSTRGF